MTMRNNNKLIQIQEIKIYRLILSFSTVLGVDEVVWCRVPGMAPIC
jgi:hypothetical protein